MRPLLLRAAGVMRVVAVLGLIAGGATLMGCSGEDKPVAGRQVAVSSRAESEQPLVRPLARPLARPGANVLLVILDTVRADRLSCYGYSRSTTPNLDEISARGVRFTNVYSNASWTLPAHASLFTGSYPMAHGATQENLSLADRYVTLAETLAAAGYATFGCSGNPVVNLGSGLAQGFASFVETFRDEAKKRYGGDEQHPNCGAFAEFLAMSNRKQPFFAFVNFVEAHLPYQPPEPFLSRFLTIETSRPELLGAMRLRMRHHYLREAGLPARQLAILGELYDGEVAYLDHLVGELLARLDADGRLQDTIVFVTSDHGENLGEHGHFAHVFDIHNTLLQVPLLVWFPDGIQAGTVRADVVQLVDLFPSILGLCGVPAGEPGDGRDLFVDGAAFSRRPAVAEYYYPRQVLSLFDEEELTGNQDRFAPFRRRLRAVQDGEAKFVWSSTGAHELYDLDQDPHEQRNLLAGSTADRVPVELTATLADLVALYGPQKRLGSALVDSAREGFEQLDDPELEEKLRSLGYVR